LFSFVGVMLAFESFWRLLACFVMTIIQSSWLCTIFCTLFYNLRFILSLLEWFYAYKCCLNVVWRFNAFVWWVFIFQALNTTMFGRRSNNMYRWAPCSKSLWNFYECSDLGFGLFVVGRIL
jgi:hypothetical protein